MAKVATRRVKYGGKWYAAGDEVPVKGDDAKLLEGQRIIAEQVSKKEAEQATRLAEKVNRVRADIEAGENALAEERTRLANLTAQAEQVTELRRLAKSNDKAEAEDAKARLEKAEEAAKQAKESEKAIKQREEEIEKLRASLRIIEE